MSWGAGVGGAGPSHRPSGACSARSGCRLWRPLSGASLSHGGRGAVAHGPGRSPSCSHPWVGGSGPSTAGAYLLLCPPRPLGSRPSRKPLSRVLSRPPLPSWWPGLRRPAGCGPPLGSSPQNQPRPSRPPSLGSARVLPFLQGRAAGRPRTVGRAAAREACGLAVSCALSHSGSGTLVSTV